MINKTMFGELPRDTTFKGLQFRFEDNIFLTLQLLPTDFLNLDHLGLQPDSLQPITVCSRQLMFCEGLVQVGLGFRDPKINKEKREAIYEITCTYGSLPGAKLWGVTGKVKRYRIP